MRTDDRVGFALLGSGFWAAGTAAYRWVGAYCFEGTSTLYWFNVSITGLLYVAVSLVLIKGRGIAQQDWLQAAICIALPGMLGEVLVLANFSEWMSNLQPETAGRYAALLFGGYALLLGSAARLSTKANLNLDANSALLNTQR